MDTASQKKVRILFWCASLAHFVGAMEVMGYNLLLRRALGNDTGSPLMRAGMVFVLATSLLGALIGRRLTRAGALKGKSPLFLPAVRAGISAASWLLSIPVLAAIAIHIQGRVHPIGFPHFVASVLIACLISTTYSATCNLWIALKLEPENSRRPEYQRMLQAFVRHLPLAASLIPVIATAMYLFFFRPWTLLPGAGKPLEMMLVAMIALGSYGTLLCRWAGKRILHEVRPLQMRL